MKLAHQQFADKMIQLLMWEAESLGYTPTDLANAVGGSPRTYENHKYGAPPTLGKFFGILRTVRPCETMKKLAEQCDGYFIKPPIRQDHPFTTIARHTAEIMKETADVVTAASETLSDGRITPLEKKRLVREIDEAIEALLSTRISLERYDAS